MNTNTLAKLYDRLSPRERLPLILAASLRGDETERERLVQSAPREVYRVPNYYGLADGLRLLSLLHMMQMLDSAIIYWRLSAVLIESAAEEGKHAREQEERLDGALRLAGYLITIEADGWRLFCERLKIDPDGLLREIPLCNPLNDIEQDARSVAFTPEEAAAWGRQRGESVKTAESVAADFEQAFDHSAKMWG